MAVAKIREDLGHKDMLIVSKGDQFETRESNLEVATPLPKSEAEPEPVLAPQRPVLAKPKAEKPKPVVEPVKEPKQV